MDITFGLVKPDAYENREEIKEMIREAGLDIVKDEHSYEITKEDAEEHYIEHKEKPFFGELIDFITSGPTNKMVIRGENAVERLAELTGPTDPADAEEGTIRARFGQELSLNAFHRADSSESAIREIGIHFNHGELPGDISDLIKDHQRNKPRIE